MLVKNMRDVRTKHLISPGDNLTAMYLYKKGCDTPSEGVVACLNSIRSQGITEVNMGGLTYTVNGVTLPLSAMSTAEKVFLWAYLADECKVPVWIYKYDTQLSTRVAKIFIERFRNSEYVHVAVEDDLTYFSTLWRDLCYN